MFLPAAAELTCDPSPVFLRFRPITSKCYVCNYCSFRFRVPSNRISVLPRWTDHIFPRTVGARMSMTFEKLRIQRNSVRVGHSWHQAYGLALRESDPGELIGRIEYAINAIERRYSEWGTDPGSPAELKAIKKCISALRRLLKREHLRKHGTVFSTASPGNSETMSVGVHSH